MARKRADRLKRGRLTNHRRRLIRARQDALWGSVDSYDPIADIRAVWRLSWEIL